MQIGHRPLSRVIFIGDSGVGKTSIIERVTTDSFSGMSTPTVGAGLTPVTLTFRDTAYKFHLWDTAGQEAYRSIVPLYFRQATCAVVVFSVDSLPSFQNLETWINLLNSHTNGDLPMVLAGNKTDVPDHTVPNEQATAWAESVNLQLFYTSAKTGVGITELFEYLTSFLSKITALERPMPKEGINQACC
jgi:small GTP-binding protein